MLIQNTGVAEPIHHGNSYVLIYCFIFQKEGPSYTKILIEGFPDSSVEKESTCNAGDPNSIPGSTGEVDRLPNLLFLGFPYGSAGKESACNVGDLGLIPGLGRYPGEGKGCPLQYSGLENFMDCIVHGVAKSRTRLSDCHFHFDRLSLTITSHTHTTDTHNTHTQHTMWQKMMLLRGKVRHMEHSGESLCPPSSTAINLSFSPPSLSGPQPSSIHFLSQWLSQ